MAWDRIVSLKKICLRIEGQSEDLAVLDGFESPYLDTTEISSYNTNPYGGVLHTYSGSNISDPTHYALTANSFYGSLNLIDYNNIVPMNGRLLIYNPNIGTTYCIYAQKTSDWSIGYKIGTTYRTFMTAVSAQDLSSTWNLGWKYGLGFLYNSDTGEYGLFQIFGGRNDVGASITFRRFLLGTAANLNNNERTNFRMVCTLVCSGNEIKPTPPSTDPYADGGYSTGTDTGTGTFDDTSDAIADPSAPALSPSIGNFVNQYVVSANALSNFGTWLYSGGNIFDNLAKVFQSPMEAIINVGILPYDPTYNHDAYVDIKVGGLNSNVQGRKITDNYEVIDMGTIDFDPFYGSALDFNPYTKCYIYLPYCGTFPLNVDEIMGHTISLKYYCDSLSGDCVAVISDEERVLEQFRGNIFIQIPITARDFSSIYTNALNSAISLAAGIATVAATGGVSAPVAVGMGTSMASNAMNSKTHYSRSGGFSGVAGFMSVQKPYVMITIPRQCLPDKQNEFQGYPLFVTKTLSDCSGFTKVYEIHLDGLDCTDAEMKEIYELLKGGVVL